MGYVVMKTKLLLLLPFIFRMDTKIKLKIKYLFVHVETPRTEPDTNVFSVTVLRKEPLLCFTK